MRGYMRALAVLWVLTLPFLLGAGPGLAEQGGQQEGPRREKGDFQVPGDMRIHGDLVVEEGDLTVDGEIRGWTVVRGGDAVVRGTVTGSVIVLYGDVVIMDSGLVQGDAVSVAGEVVIRGSGVVSGSNITTTRRGLERQGRDVPWARIVREAGVLEHRDPGSRREEGPWERWWDEEPEEERFGARGRRRGGYDYLFDGSFPLGGLLYNRVDGLTLQGEVFGDSGDWGSTGANLYGGAGYAFESGRFYYRLGLSRFFFGTAPLEIGGSIYRQLETHDTWYMTPNENDWMALLARYDWYDYYLREGVQGHVQFSPTRWLRLGALYSEDTEEAVFRNTNWSIFGTDRSFRENEWLVRWHPDDQQRVYAGAHEGDIRRLTWFLHVDAARRARVRPSRGVELDTWYETAGEAGIAGGGDFHYERAVAELRAYQRISRMDHLALRVRAGTVGSQSGLIDDVPVQHRFYLGGVGSLRGYDLKQFSGDRLFLATLEYTLGGDGWGPVFGDWALTFFYDWGNAWRAEAGEDLFGGLIPPEAVRSAGAAVSPVGWGGPRLEIARPIDAEDDEFRWYLRWAFDF
ncbi:MAG: BamA/TamA family outer membrane protein [bacterium]